MSHEPPRDRSHLRVVGAEDRAVEATDPDPDFDTPEPAGPIQPPADDAATGEKPPRSVHASSNGKTSKRNILAKERRREALRMRLAGHKYQEIADALGYKSKQTAYVAVKREMDKIPAEPAERLKDVHRMRYESLLAGVWDEATMGSVEALNAALKIMAQQEKLEGLAAPKEVKVEQNTTSHHTESVLVLDATVPTHDYIAQLQRVNGFVPPAPQAIEAAQTTGGPGGAGIVEDVVDGEVVE